MFIIYNNNKSIENGLRPLLHDQILRVLLNNKGNILPMQWGNKHWI